MKDFYKIRVIRWLANSTSLWADTFNLLPDGLMIAELALNNTVVVSVLACIFKYQVN